MSFVEFTLNHFRKIHAMFKKERLWLYSMSFHNLIGMYRSVIHDGTANKHTT